jgi:hypothetical protein
MKRGHNIFHARVGLGGFHKKRAGTCCAELVFSHPVGSMGHIVHSGAHLGHRTSTYYFSCLGGPGAVSIKSVRTHYAEFVFFLHSVESAGQVVHFGASGTRNVDALFFMVRWARYGFHKKSAGTHYAKLVFYI